MLIEAGAGESIELFKEILGLFEEESKIKLAAIRETADSADFDALSRAAHALAGSSANIGGREVWLKAREIENLCKAGNGDQAVARVSDLEDTYQKTMIQLRHFVSQVDGK